jgi:hypothetical protein
MRCQPAAATRLTDPQLAQKEWRRCQSSIDFALPSIPSVPAERAWRATGLHDRLRHDGFGATRQYHAFGLVRVVCGTGESFWRLVIGKWALAFGYEKRKQVQP